jgi:HSP20 family protein
MTIQVHRPHGSVAEIIHWLEDPLRALHTASGQPMRAEEHLSDNSYVLRVEIPGVDPGRDIDVTVGGGILTVTARRHPEAGAVPRSELCYGTFRRGFRLPPHVDQARIQASYGHGVLEITAFLSDAGTGPRRVPVRANQHIEPT